VKRNVLANDVFAFDVLLLEKKGYVVFDICVFKENDIESKETKLIFATFAALTSNPPGTALGDFAPSS
jgi:hypothetical protein